MNRLLQKPIILALIFLGVLSTSIHAQEEPPLPQGLSDEPALPQGLSNDEPALPSGMNDNETSQSSSNETDSFDEPPVNISYFLEARGGIRTQEDQNEGDFPIGEFRGQIKIDKQWEKFSFDIVADFLYDPVLDNHTVNLETGEGFIDLRSANILFTPFRMLDVRVGRQILTWGTGDLLFINDMFPKDWNSFFIGRDNEYLKAPSDALKASFYSDYVNFDFVYTPRFDSDRYIDGKRISYWSDNFSSIVGQNAIVNVDKPSTWFDNDEFSFRLFKNIDGIELALYAYLGYWKSPGGQSATTGLYIFPELNVYGGSARFPLIGGIANVEVGYYDSRDDSAGDNAYIKNSEFRALVGYEREVAKELTLALQYYLEHMINYGNYKATLPGFVNARDEDRHLITLRLTKFLMNQNLKLMMFTYFSQSDMDTYIRPKIHYKFNNNLLFDLGANIFLGENQYTFFGQFEKNTNVYMAIRYSGIFM